MAVKNRTWQRGAWWRMIAYLAPLICFIVLHAYIQPETRLDRAIIGLSVGMIMMASLFVAASAVAQKRKRIKDHQSRSTMAPQLSSREQYVGPGGIEQLNVFLGEWPQQSPV